MSRVTLKVVRAIKQCSLDEPELIAMIQGYDKPAPAPEVAEIIAPTRRRGRYSRKDMQAAE